MSKMIQNNFGGGEISPSLYGRSDLQAYYKGCSDAENFVISKEGTLRKRHGITSFMTLTEDYSRVKVIPYKYDRSQGGFFVLSYAAATPTTVSVKFYNNAGTLLDTDTISSFSGSLKELQSKQIGDEIWISNGSIFKMLRVTTTSEETPMSSATFEIISWSQTAVPDLILHNDIVATQSTHWSIVRSTSSSSDRTIYYGVVSSKDGVNSEICKGECGWTQTWQAASYIDIVVTIDKDDRTKWDTIIVAKRTGGGYGELARFYPQEDADEYYTSNYTRCYKWSNGKYYDVQEGTTTGATEMQMKYCRWTFRDENHDPSDMIYGQTNVLGKNFTNPLCVDCFQQRRVFGNGENDNGKLPMTLWFSEVGNLNNFYSDRPAAADDAFSPSIASSGPAFILFTVAYQEMMILFTESGLFSIGFSQQSGFSASSCRISKFSDLACAPDIQPIVTEAGIVFVGADKKTVYSISYDLSENMMKPINRSVLTEHLTRITPVVSIALQDYPDNVVWVVTSDGKICSFTVEKNEQVYSWSHSRINGAKIIDVIGLGTCADSLTDRTYAELLYVVEQTVGEGSEAVTTQYLCKQNTGYSDTIGGVTRNVCASLTTLRPESQERTIMGSKKNLKDVLLRLYQTGGIAVRSPEGNHMPLVPAKMSGELYTGDIKVMPRGYVNDSGQLNLVSDNDKACEVLQIVIEMEIDG